MDKKEEQQITRRIIKGVSEKLVRHGFTHTKNNWIVKPNEHSVGFFHFHKFSHSPKFRIHVGVRVLADTDEAISLSRGLYKEQAGEFSDDEQSINECITTMSNYCINKGIPWLEKFSNTHTLLEDKDSPLNEKETNLLRMHTEGKFDAEAIKKSKKILGIKKI
jgi:hypothetical protein